MVDFCRTSTFDEGDLHWCPRGNMWRGSMGMCEKEPLKRPDLAKFCKKFAIGKNSDQLQ